MPCRACYCTPRTSIRGLYRGSSPIHHDARPSLFQAGVGTIFAPIALQPFPTGSASRFESRAPRISNRRDAHLHPCKCPATVPEKVTIFPRFCRDWTPDSNHIPADDQRAGPRMADNDGIRRCSGYGINALIKTCRRRTGIMAGFDHRGDAPDCSLVRATDPELQIIPPRFVPAPEVQSLGHHSSFVS